MATKKSVQCTIERRLLVNYRIDPELVMAQLPAPFRPQMCSGWAVGGVCFIRRDLRLPHVPRPWFDDGECRSPVCCRMG